MKLDDFFKQKRATQNEIADALGITQGWVSHWVNGRSKVPAELVIPLYWATDGEVTPFEVRPDCYPDQSWLPPVAKDCA
jgi:DNA-binding transcriptional regulator YdaS (Cro superfamily)